MKTNTKIIVILYVIFLLNLLVIGQQYYQLPKKIISAEHIWVFDKEDISKILIQHLRSIGTNVPHGKIELYGLETHYSPYSTHPQLELTVKEFSYDEQTKKSPTTNNISH